MRSSPMFSAMKASIHQLKAVSVPSLVQDTSSTMSLTWLSVWTPAVRVAAYSACRGRESRFRATRGMQ